MENKKEPSYPQTANHSPKTDRRLRPVRNDTSGKTYPSLAAAARALKSDPNTVCAAIRKRISVRGNYLSHLDGPPATPRVDKRTLRSLPFQDEAGRSFRTLAEGAAFYGCTEATLWQALNIFGSWNGHVFKYSTVCRDLPAHRATPSRLCATAAELTGARVTLDVLAGLIEYSPAVRQALCEALKGSK